MSIFVQDVIDYAQNNDDRAASFFQQNMYGHFVKHTKFPTICDVSAREFANCYIPLISPSCPYQNGFCANAAWQSFEMAQKMCAGDMSMPQPIVDANRQPKAAAATKQTNPAPTSTSDKTDTPTTKKTTEQKKTKKKATKKKEYHLDLDFDFALPTT